MAACVGAVHAYQEFLCQCSALRVAIPVCDVPPSGAMPFGTCLQCVVG